MYQAVMLVEQGVQDEEFVHPYYRMQEEGWEVTIASIGGAFVTGKHGISVPATRIIARLETTFDLVYIPGGWQCPEKLRMHRPALEYVGAMHAGGKLIASICHGPQVLISAGIVRGRTVTGYPGIRDDLLNAGAIYPDTSVVRDGNLITAQHYRDLPAFMREVIAYMRTVQPRAYAESHAI